MLQSRTADDTTPLSSSQGPQPTTGLPHSKGEGSTNVLVGNETGWVGWVGGWVGHCNQVLTVVRSSVTAGSLTNIVGKLKERGKRNYLFTGWPASQGQGPHTIPNTPKAMLSEMHFHQQHLGACEKQSLLSSFFHSGIKICCFTRSPCDSCTHEIGEHQSALTIVTSKPPTYSPIHCF